MSDRGAPTDQEEPSSRLITSVRRGSLILKVGAIVLVVGALVSSFISATTDLNQLYGGPSVDLPWRIDLANFLQAAIPPLAWSSLVLAAAYGLDLAAAHLARRTPAAASPQIVGPPPRPPVEAPLDDSMWRP